MKALSTLKTYLGAMAALVMLASCEDPIDITTDLGPAQLAVEGWVFDDRDVQQVKLTKTQGYFNSSTPPAVQGATVTVLDGAGTVHTYSEVSPGVYQSTFRGQIGLTYQLRIQAEGQTYTAFTSLNRIPQRIDTIRQEFVKADPGNDEDRWEVRPVIRDLRGEGDFYRVRGQLVRDRPSQGRSAENKWFNKPENISITNDQNGLDGLALIPPVVNAVNAESFFPDDSITVECWSISRDAYQFYVEARTQMTNSGLFADPPANVRTNVRNTDSKGPKAVGYFGASAVIRRGIRIKP